MATLHRVENKGPRPIIVASASGALITVDPSEVFEGIVLAIKHGDGPAHYTVCSLDDVVATES